MVHALQRYTPEENAVAEYLGFSWVLTTFYWGSVQPQRDVWRLDHYDAFVENAEANDKKIMVVLGYDAGWIHAEDGSKSDYIPPESLPYWLEYVENMVLRYRGRVDAWEIWNEPDIQRFWTGTKSEYYTLVKETAALIRRLAPEAIITTGAFAMESLDWFKGLSEAGALEHIDYFCFHPYHMNALYSVGKFNQFRKYAARYGFGERIWVNEIGFPTEGFFIRVVREADMAAELTKTIVGLAASGAAHIFWYQLFDPSERDPNDWEDWFGLLNNDYSLKGGAAAYSLLARHLPGKTWMPDKFKVGNAETYYFGGKGNLLVIWNDWGASYTLDLPDARNIQVHNPIDGSSRRAEHGEKLSLGKTPWLITWE